MEIRMFDRVPMIKAYALRTISMGEMGARDLAAHVWQRIDKDDVFGHSAQLSYYFILALFPLLIFLYTVLGYVFASQPGLHLQMIDYFGQVMPQPAFELMRGAFDEITEASGGGKLTFGIALALWTASSGMEAIIESLNVAYAVPEFRPRWRRRLVAIGLTIALGVLVAMALFLIVASNVAARVIGDNFPVLERIAAWSSMVQWAIGLLFLLLALSLIFRFAPNLRQSRWEGNLPGAVLALIVWVLASVGLRLYLSTFDSFNRTYGSLGAVIVLLVWLYVSGAAILIGGELNSVIWQSVVRKRESSESTTSD
jgi:membrane protein